MAGLGDVQASAVLRADNYERAKKFYTEVLGLKEMPIPGMTGGGVFTAGEGSAITVYERPGMPAPQNTTLAFVVKPDQFDGIIADLRGKGVKLEDYDIPEIGLKTMNGIADYGGSKSAWFKDTEGNILNVVTM